MVEWLRANITLAAADHMRLMECRSEFLKELNEDISTVMIIDIGSIEMTNSEISGLNDLDNSIFDKEIPEILDEIRLVISNSKRN